MTPIASSRPKWLRAASDIWTPFQITAANMPKQQHQAEKAELLADDGQDEIGLLLGQEVEPALRPHQESLAEETAGAERDLRLQ